MESQQEHITKVHKTLTERLRTIYFLSMIKENPSLGRINQNNIPGFGPILKGLVGFKPIIEIPERAQYLDGSGFPVHFHLSSGILDYTGEDGSSVSIDILDRDYKVVDYRKDEVYHKLKEYYTTSRKEHGGFHDFFDKEEGYYCSLFDILSGRAKRKGKVIFIPNGEDREKVALMEDILEEYRTQLERGSRLAELIERGEEKGFLRAILERRRGLTKKAYELIKEKIESGKIYKDIYTEVMDFCKYFRSHECYWDASISDLEFKNNCNVIYNPWMRYRT
jgi:hypothetical protein